MVLELTGMTLTKQLFRVVFFFLFEWINYGRFLFKALRKTVSTLAISPIAKDDLKLHVCNDNELSQQQMSDRFWPLLWEQ